MEWLVLIGIIIAIIYLVGSKDKKLSSKSGYHTSQNLNGGRQVTNVPSVPPKLNVEKADVDSVRLSDEQQKVYDIIENSNNNVYITGKAGTGKSLLLEYFVGHTRKTVAVVAPTGIAALNVGGMTIHSFFKFPPDVIDPKNVNVDYKTREILRNIDAIVIDEVSMIRVDLMEGISAKLQIARRDDRPFGGCQMIMFGDLYQLPPVVTDGQLHRYFNHNYGGIYFFNAPSIEKTNLQIYELSNIFRQKDPEFREVLNAIRNGDGSPEVLSKLNVRTGVQIPETGFVTLAGTNNIVSRINHKKLAELEGVEREYQAEVWGDIKEQSFPTEKKLKLKIGAQVMMLKNDEEKPRRWVNGTLGVITRLGAESVRVNIDGVEHTVNQATWKKYRYDYDHEERKLTKQVVSEFTQLPMRLAWAITIHKSQGQTYESVAVDMSAGAFAHGQTYVALSRCKSMEGLYLTTAIRREDVIVDQEIVDFMKKANR
ncbi:MAG: PIF1 family ATP-dependent DNA helicase [Candidatus Saccharimonas sp.]